MKISTAIIAFVVATLSALVAPHAQTDVTEGVLVGTWEADFSTFMANQPMTDEERAMMLQAFEGAHAVWIMSGDHTASYTAQVAGQTESKTGTWMLSTTESGQTLTMTDSEGEVDVLMVSMTDPDTLIVGLSEGDAMTWRRQTAATEPPPQATTQPAAP